MANVGVMLKQKQGTPCMVKWIGNILNRTALKVRFKICRIFSSLNDSKLSSFSNVSYPDVMPFISDLTLYSKRKFSIYLQAIQTKIVK